MMISTTCNVSGIVIKCQYVLIFCGFYEWHYSLVKYIIIYNKIKIQTHTAVSYWMENEKEMKFLNFISGRGSNVAASVAKWVGVKPITLYLGFNHRRKIVTWQHWSLNNDILPSEKKSVIWWHLDWSEGIIYEWHGKMSSMNLNPIMVKWVFSIFLCLDKDMHKVVTLFIHTLSVEKPQFKSPFYKSR